MAILLLVVQHKHNTFGTLIRDLLARLLVEYQLVEHVKLLSFLLLALVLTQRPDFIDDLDYGQLLEQALLGFLGRPFRLVGHRLGLNEQEVALELGLVGVLLLTGVAGLVLKHVLQTFGEILDEEELSDLLGGVFML